MGASSWARLVYHVSRGLTLADRTQQLLRDELLFAFLPPEQRCCLTLEAYGLTSSFSPGGDAFTLGLFPWELRLLEHPLVPRAGRVLLAAAGGGRELQSLLERGYEVCAFEPVPTLARQARELSLGSKAVVWQASYADLVRRVQERGGPLAALQGPFDLCYLGWGSLSHLTQFDESVRVLRSVKVLAPAAPVLASFLMRSSAPPPALGRARKLRQLTRRALQACGGRTVAAGLEFSIDAGFVYAYSRQEVSELAERAGYGVAYLGETDYPHAVLLPRITPGKTDSIR